tara:strand:+ start:161944 stop:163191 length:1248 start_codon:yes stop_codon:yes gene_type:complete
MKKLETIDDAIAKIRQATNENSSVDERAAIINEMSTAAEQDLQKTLQAQIAAATAEHQAALQATQAKEQDAQTFISSADTIANALQASAQNELIDMDAVKTSIHNLSAAGFDLSEDETVKTLFSAAVCGIKDMNINTELQLKSALNAAEKVNYEITKNAAITAICDNYELITCAEDKAEYITLSADALKDLAKTAQELNVSEGSLLNAAEKLETSADAKENGAYLRSLQTIKDAYAATKTSIASTEYAQTVTTSIATIDNAINTIKAGGAMDADDIISLTLGEEGIKTQCQFDAKAKYLMCDADTDRIHKEMLSLQAPKDRKITITEVNGFRKIDFSTARLKAVGLSDETCEKIQEQAQGLLSAFTSMALRPDASDPKAAYYPTSAQEQESAMSTLAINAYSEMISASTKKLAMS